MIVTGVVTGACGVGLATKGGYEIKKASSRIQEASERYSRNRRTMEVYEADTNAALRSLGARQEEAFHDVVQRMADFLRRHQKLVSESEKLLVDGLDPVSGEVRLDSGLGQDPIAWLRGIAGSAATGVGVNKGITSAVRKSARAGTGRPISTLHGAAEKSATQAFLGGGPKASGGGGEAAGNIALQFATGGPAMLVSGFVVAVQGEKAKSKARKFEASVNIAIAEMQATKARFDAIVGRASELESLLEQLVMRAASALDILESEPFDPDRAEHAVRFEQARTLTYAVLDVASAKVVDESGVLNEESASMKVRYRALIKESDDD